MDSDTDACVRDLDPSRGSTRHFVCHDHLVVCPAVSNQVVVRCLEECADCNRFVVRPVRPGAYFAKARNDRQVGWYEQLRPLFRPFGQTVITGLEFGAHPFDAGYGTGRAGSGDPVPERGAEVEPVVQILGLDEDVRVEQLPGHTTLNSLARPSKVAAFLNPSIRNASVYRV